MFDVDLIFNLQHFTFSSFFNVNIPANQCYECTGLISVYSMNPVNRLTPPLSVLLLLSVFTHEIIYFIRLIMSVVLMLYWIRIGWIWRCFIHAG